ncbi:DUF3592 domain-containing protein [Streptomyces adustus]|uniref:DUF3592 domain-containing protein n=1 Tax=Streptomyces adustus TaxID=1609272 RepID=UPI0037139696
MFYAVPGLMIALMCLLAYTVLRRLMRLRMAWRSGLTAEARCLRTFTTVHGGSGDTSVSTTLHHVYEFTALDGRTVRFEEKDGPATVMEGDFVTVYYKDGPREVFATAHPPRRGRVATATTVGILAFCGLIVGLCIGFMVTVGDLFSSMSDF